MLFNHLNYYSVLQVGMHVAISLMEVCGVLLGTPRGLVGSVFAKQKNREFKLKYLKKLFDNTTSFRRCMEGTSISRLFRCWLQDFVSGTFILGNENAAGSAICIHKDTLPEEAIETHLITCQGRDLFCEPYSLGDKAWWLSTSMSNWSLP